jgi:hypothetical protein
MRTMISAATVASQPLGFIAIITPAWMLNCVVIPGDSSPIATFRQAGFKGLVKVE